MTATTPDDDSVMELLSHVTVGAVAETVLHDRTVRLPDGRVKRHVAVVSRPRAVGVLPIRTGPSGETEVLLCSQPRPAVDNPALIEVCAGKMDPADGGDPYVTGARELAEEAGLAADRWGMLLPDLLPTPGWADERVTLLIARDLSEVPSRSEDAHIHGDWYRLADAVTAIGHRIFDAKTVIALLLAARSELLADAA